MKKPGEDPEEFGEIETKTVEDVKDEPYNMPPGFEWCHVDVMNAAEAEVRRGGRGGAGVAGRRMRCDRFSWS